jgi:hypothetical protein
LKRAMESVEAYRSQQLDKLRENYTQQVLLLLTIYLGSFNLDLKVNVAG